MADLSLMRLGGKDADGQPFFQPWHLAAAERLEQLVSRARLAPRLTMSYGGSVSGRSKTVNLAGELSDSAADARRRLNDLAGTLPADCWSVALDVCCFGRGLQDIETARRWPRRSAKLVLRIALDHLARHFGLAPHRADGNARVTAWLDERLPIIDRTSV